MKGFRCVIGAITFDLGYFSLFAFRGGIEGARFADGEGSGVDCGREIESTGLVRADIEILGNNAP